MASKPPAGWYHITGGPHDGQQFYAPNEPVPGRPVFLGTAQLLTEDGVRSKPRETNYHYLKTPISGIVVAWSEKVSREGTPDA